jgi:hypothetical protein
MSIIRFQDKEYKTREIFVPTFGLRTISVFSLEKELLNAEFSNYISNAARHIDEGIFYFVQDNEIDFPDEKLSKIVYNSIL